MLIASCASLILITIAAGCRRGSEREAAELTGGDPAMRTIEADYQSGPERLRSKGFAQDKPLILLRERVCSPAFRRNLRQEAEWIVFHHYRLKAELRTIS
jgi:hypothetical protein